MFQKQKENMHEQKIRHPAGRALPRRGGMAVLYGGAARLRGTG